MYQGDPECPACGGQPQARYCPRCGALPVIDPPAPGPRPAPAPPPLPAVSREAVVIAWERGILELPAAAFLLGCSQRAVVHEIGRERVKALAAVRGMLETMVIAAIRDHLAAGATENAA